MAKATFTNEQLCRAWNEQATAEPKGTRKDVVKALMVTMGTSEDGEEAFSKAYNNVTQRVKQLAGHASQPVVFPKLAAGKKGARRTVAQMQALQSIFTVETKEGEGEESTETLAIGED